MLNFDLGCNFPLRGKGEPAGSENHIMHPCMIKWNHLRTSEGKIILSTNTFTLDFLAVAMFIDCFSSAFLCQTSRTFSGRLRVSSCWQLSPLPPPQYCSQGSYQKIRAPTKNKEIKTKKQTKKERKEENRKGKVAQTTRSKGPSGIIATEDIQSKLRLWRSLLSNENNIWEIWKYKFMDLVRFCWNKTRQFQFTDSIKSILNLFLDSCSNHNFLYRV